MGCRWTSESTSQRRQQRERAAFFKGYAEKKYQNLIQAANGAFGNAATRIEAFVASGGAYVYGSYADIDGPFREQATELDRKQCEAMGILCDTGARRDWCDLTNGALADAAFQEGFRVILTGIVSSGRRLVARRRRYRSLRSWSRLCHRLGRRRTWPRSRRRGAGSQSNRSPVP